MGWPLSANNGLIGSYRLTLGWPHKHASEVALCVLTPPPEVGRLIRIRTGPFTSTRNRLEPGLKASCKQLKRHTPTAETVSCVLRTLRKSSWGLSSWGLAVDYVCIFCIHTRVLIFLTLSLHEYLPGRTASHGSILATNPPTINNCLQSCTQCFHGDMAPCLPGRPGKCPGIHLQPNLKGSSDRSKYQLVHAGLKSFIMCAMLLPSGD